MVTSLQKTPLNALRSFDAAARRLSFAAAAEELGVTASAVSLQIRRLEARIGRPLFVRGHRSVTLSPTGERLAPRLTALYVELERLLFEVVEPELASLQISAMPSFATKWVAPRLSTFTARHPDLQIRIVGSDDLCDFDRDGVDIGLRYGGGAYGDLHCERIAAATAFPVCSAAFASARAAELRSPAGLIAMPLLSDESSLRAPDLPSWNDWFEKAGVERMTESRGPLFESIHMALAAAIAGQGFALGLTPLVDDDLAAGRLVKPFAIELPSAYAFWFVCRKDRLRERKVAAFRRWVFDQAGQRPESALSASSTQTAS